MDIYPVIGVFMPLKRRNAEGLVTRLTEVLLGAIVRMSIFVEIRGITV